MTAVKRVLRVFFNTYYEDSAREALERLRRLLSQAGAGEPRVARSQVVRELYYVEAEIGKLNSREEAEGLARKVASELGSIDTVFGVKAYIIWGED